MITLYTFDPLFGLPDGSPFVRKRELLLKLAKLDFRTSTKGFLRAPKSKLPYTDDDGTLVAESTLIRLHLEKQHGIDLDRGPSNCFKRVRAIIRPLVIWMVRGTLASKWGHSPFPSKRGRASKQGSFMNVFRLLAVGILALQLSTATFADGLPLESRLAFLHVIKRPIVALKPELAAMPPVEGLAKYHLWFSADATERVPGYLLLPDPVRFKGRRPVVIALHGTGGTKDGGQIAELVLKAARAGFIGVAIDARFHGERTKAGSGAAEYNEAITQAFKTGVGHPFYFDTAWDVMRLIDYLATRKDVDAVRIGLTGISKGGIETYLTAAADLRVAAAVSYIGVQGFKWALDNGQWRARIATIQGGFDAAAAAAGKPSGSVDFVREFYARVAPGIDGPFDGPAMLAAIAPRPLLVINGDSDANTPIAGVRLAVAAARPLYDAADASDRLQFMVQENTPHRVNPESIDAGIVWFVRWLKPQW